MTTMKRMVLLFSLGIALLAIGCGEKKVEEAEEVEPKQTVITVGAAASLKNAFDEIGREFHHTTPNVTVRFNYAASNLLARQIEQGAPFDLVALAAEQTMNELDSAGLIQPGSRFVFARNRLGVLVSPATTVPLTTLDDLRHSYYTRIAIASPGVPARIYAEEALRNAGLWDELEPHFVYGANVRQVLDYVERGEADCGFVYTSDASNSMLDIALVVDTTLYRPIRYPAAIVGTSANAAAGRKFLTYLTTPKCRAILKEHGFE